MFAITVELSPIARRTAHGELRIRLIGENTDELTFCLFG